MRKIFNRTQKKQPSEYTWTIALTSLKHTPRISRTTYTAYQYDHDTWAVFENDYCLDDLVSTHELQDYCTKLMSSKYPSQTLSGENTWEDFITQLFKGRESKRLFTFDVF